MDDLALFTLSQLKLWLKIPDADTTQDDVLNLLGQGASDYCEDRIGEQFLTRTYTVTRDGKGTSRLLRLPRPIQSVTSLTIDGVLIDPSQYVVDPDAGKITLLCGQFTCGAGNVVAVLVAGYDAGKVPGNVVAAALDLAKSHYEEWTNGAISVSSISIGPASTVIRPGLNPRIEKFLDARGDTRG